jgi:calcineurin-like phosphoesterase family protein
MSVYFTSDLHLGHKAIHIYRADKFSSQEEHDEYILSLIDSLDKRDVLIVLGDFIFDSPNYDYYIKRIKKAKCRIKVIMGNHDSLKLYKEDCLEMQLPLFSYKNMWLSHAPIHNTELRNRLGNIHGHLHKDSTDGIYRVPDNRYFNVNIDVNNYQLVSLDEIKEYYKNLK